jgi:preprotein translocase subunit SecA
MDWDDFTDKLSNFGDQVGRTLKRAFGSRNERYVRTLDRTIAQVAGLEAWAQGLTADQFKSKTEEFRADLSSGAKTLDQILPEAFALVREAAVRTLGMRHFDVQILGGIILHRGAIAEMMTGEGKTLVATLPLYLNCLEGKPVYLVTVNDYLARRDCAWMKPIYDYLGVTCGAIQSDMNPYDRQPIYACNIVYGTNNEFGFDYLRDNMKVRLEQQVQRFLNYAIVDEVDSILIDEARTPLIISGPAEESSDKYKIADRIARGLQRDVHFEVKEKERSASLLEEGIVESQRQAGVESFYTPGNEEWPHYIENAVRAHHLYLKDREYVVEQGEVIIVDEFTGRKMNGRRWSDGLHQAVEAKEGLPPRQENQTLATITFQNYFRLFKKLAGMTGTAMTEANEFFKIYKLDVISIPSNLPVARIDHNDIVYRTEKEKWKAIAEEIERAHAAGQPILVGTTSVEKSEIVDGMLSRRGIRHEVLNAKNHEREASIVARAGEKGSVTVSTNMAGRGTDIKLGGNFEWRLRFALEEAGLVEGDEAHLAEIDAIRARLREDCDRDEKEVLALGGLYVLGTERHEARRIDNQLRGRTGRQGNVGNSRFFLSLEDDLMRRFYRDWVNNAMGKLGMDEGTPIESRMVSRAIQRAQKKVEDYNFEIRKSLLEYDEVMDQQRKTIYGVRQEVLAGVELREKAERMLARALDRAAQTWAGDGEAFAGWFHRTFGTDIDREIAAHATSEDGTTDAVFEAVQKLYDERVAAVGEETMRRIEQYILLNAIDSRWKDHLYALDSLKLGIGLRGYGQVDPKNEYKREGFELFQKLFATVEDEVASLLLRIRIGSEVPERQVVARAPALSFQGPAKVSPGGPARPVRLAPARIPASRAFDIMQRQALAAAPPPRAGPAQAAPSGGPTAPAQPPGQPMAQPTGTAPAPGQQAPSARAAAGEAAKAVGRNDPCPCGSGKKYKKCHGGA